MDKVENQYIGYPATNLASRRDGEKGGNAQELFDNNTPLSVLFRKSSHEELKERIMSWRPYMFQHSNLSKSEKALYVQLKRYRSMCK